MSLLRKRRPVWASEWGLHKNAMRALLVHTFLGAIRDAERPPREHDYDPTVLRQWVESNRFEFWVEWLDIPADVAEGVIKEIEEKKLNVANMLRTETGRRRAPNEPRHRTELYEWKNGRDQLK